MSAVSYLKDFCKTARCPSSEMLLSYRLQRSAVAEQIVIQSHLRDCDFCSAELQLLKLHQHEIEHPKPSEVPSQIRRLAETVLLGNRALLPMRNVVVYTGPLSH
jgi:hypothetical protein